MPRKITSKTTSKTGDKVADQDVAKVTAKASEKVTPKASEKVNAKESEKVAKTTVKPIVKTPASRIKTTVKEKALSTAIKEKPVEETEESSLSWENNTELVGLEFELVPQVNASIYPQYIIGLHAWFLDQVRGFDPELSAYLHNGESEKPFTVSALDGEMVSSGKNILLKSGQVYRWYVTALSNKVAKWMAKWVNNLPEELYLRDICLQIRACNIVHAATTYQKLLSPEELRNISLTFISPTSFRRKGHHLPLPIPVNLFQSYLRRWNDFSGTYVDQSAFLDWVENSVFLSRLDISSVKVLAAKKGAVTGFTGAIELGVSQQGDKHEEFYQLFYALLKLAPYCGTGHKTTFGLGQTRFGWLSNITPDVPDMESVLAKRIEDLTAIFKAQRKRTGGDRAIEIASKWATILARREMGESLQVIASDMGIPYETVKTYVKLSRRSLKNQDSD
jgi:CRISPR-associated endoribonuclease Cas6